jgi:hypothetical protein
MILFGVKWQRTKSYKIVALKKYAIFDKNSVWKVLIFIIIRKEHQDSK